MHALIDFDIIQYEFGNCTQEDGVAFTDWSYVQSRVDERISGILQAVNATSYQGYLTASDKSNFRFEVATIRPYKGHRPTERPHYYEAIRAYLKGRYKAVEVFEMEADDRLGIEQIKGQLPYKENGALNTICKDTIICTLDKDLNMIPGWHYNWRKDEKFFITDEDGLKCFYSQLLTGDLTDNILGLYGVGPKSSLVRMVNDCTNELGMYSIVCKAYQDRFGSYWWKFLIENAGLLWILRCEPTDGMYRSQIVLRLSDLRWNLGVGCDIRDTKAE